MAAKKRQSRGLRGLGGTPAEHQIIMKGWAEAAKSAFNDSATVLEATRTPNAKECRYALSWLTMGQEDLGRAEAHLDEASQLTTGASMVPVRKLGGDARRLFETKCLRDKTVSGLGRSPRRRRR